MTVQREQNFAVNLEDIDAPILFYFIYLFIACLKLPWSQGKSFKEAVETKRDFKENLNQNSRSRIFNPSYG